MTPRIRAAILVALAAACFGAMAVFARHAYRVGVDPLALLFIRFSLAAAVLVPVMAAYRTPWPQGRALGALILMGGLGYVSQSLSFFSALQYAPAALVALLLYLHPVLIALVGRYVMGEAMGFHRAASIAVALIGTAFVLGFSHSAQWQGYALGVLAAVLYSIYLMTGQSVLAGVTPLAAATTVIVSAAGVFGVLCLATTPQWPTTPESWGAAVAIAIVSTVFAILLLFAGMRVLGATDAATISMLEPVVTAFLGVWLLGESLSAFQWIGIGLVVMAVIRLVRCGAPQPTDVSPSRK